MRIGLDFDGVIIDHSLNKIKVARALGFELVDWQTHTNVMHGFIPENVLLEIKEHIYNDLTLEAPPIAEAIEHIRELGGEPYIVSARRPSAVKYAEHWLREHGVFEVIPTDRVFFVGSSQDKHQYVKKFDLKVFLDDKLAVLESLPDSVHTVLFDAHNSTDRFGIQHKHHTATGWKDFLQELAQVIQ